MPPAVEPLQERILQTILTDLRKITGGSNYWHTVLSDAVARQEFSDVTIDTFPSIQVAAGLTEYDVEPRETRVLRVISAHMYVPVRALIEDRSTPTVSIHRLIRDVHKAIHTNRRRNDGTTDLALDSWVYSSDPRYPAAPADPVCGADFVIFVNYRFSIDDPDTVN